MECWSIGLSHLCNVKFAKLEQEKFFLYTCNHQSNHKRDFMHNNVMDYELAKVDEISI